MILIFSGHMNKIIMGHKMVFGYGFHSYNGISITWILWIWIWFLALNMDPDQSFQHENVTMIHLYTILRNNLF